MTRSQSTPQSSQIVWLEARVKELAAQVTSFALERSIRQMAESKRYGLTADRIDELAAQIEVMRLALENARAWHRCDEWRDCDDESNRDAWQMQMNRIDDALALPNTAAAILRQRDARTLREAAAIAVEWGNARKPGQGGHALWNYADHIRTKADELESKNG